MWKYLSFILIVLFFTLLAIYSSKGKNKDFEDFSECPFIDSDEFSNTYAHIFKVIKNMKKVLIVAYIYICLNVLNDFIEDFCLKEGGNE